MGEHTPSKAMGESPRSNPGPNPGPADAAPNNWVDRLAPAPWRPYLRLARFDRPVGIWLLMLPGWWGISLGAAPGAAPDLRLLALFLVGATAMRAAGCIFNDIVDREFDARVERTRNRPIASGQVSVAGAATWMAVLLLVGAAVLVQLNGLAMQIGLASMLLVLTYPFMKRLTFWPQAFLGITFNWGVLVGYAAATGEMKLEALTLYLGAIFWTLAYDTIYAHQDKEDDALIGVKSTALLFGERSRGWIGGFYGLAALAFLATGVLAELNAGYFMALGVAAALLAWQTLAVNFADPQDCLVKFRSNQWVALVLFLGLAGGRLF